MTKPLRHPLDGVEQARGRVVTALSPEGYVLVDGLLMRAVLAAGQARIGEDVLLRPDAAGGVLAAYGPGAPQPGTAAEAAS